MVRVPDKPFPADDSNRFRTPAVKEIPQDTVSPANETPFQRRLRQRDQDVIPKRQDSETPFQSRLRRMAGVLNRSIEEGKKLPSDVGRRFLALRAKLRNMPDDLIFTNLDEFESQVAKPGFDAETFIRQSPVVARHLAQHPAFAQMEEKEILALKDLEIFLRRGPTQWPMPDAVVEKMAERNVSRRQRRFAQMVEVIAGKALSVGRQIDTKTIPIGFLPGGVDTAFSGEELSILRRAIGERGNVDLAKEIEILQADEAFIAGDKPVGAVEIVRRRFQENPAFLVAFVSGGIDAERILELYEAAKAVEAGSASEEQTDILIRFTRLAQASDRRGTTFFGDVAAIMADLPAFATEFGLTGPIYRGVKGVLFKGAEEVAEAFIRRAALKAIKGLVTPRIILPKIAASLAQSVVASGPRIVGEVFQRMTPLGRTVLDDGSIAFQVIPGTGAPFVVALPQAIVNAWTEIASERVGGTALFRLLDNKLNNALFKRWLKVNTNGTAKAFQKALRAGGINGVLGEFTEERVASLLKALTGLGPFSDIIPTGKQAGAELVAFSILPAAGGIINQVGARFLEPPVQSSEGFIKNLNQQMTRLADVAPETKEIIVDEIGKETGRKFLRGSVDKWDERWLAQKDEQGRPFDPREVFIEIVGNAKAYDDAKLTGADLKIPIGKYAAQLADTEHAEFFQSEFKLTPEEQNLREIEEEDKERREANKKSTEAFLKGQTPFNADFFKPIKLDPTQTFAPGVADQIISFADLDIKTPPKEEGEAKPQTVSVTAKKPKKTELTKKEEASARRVQREVRRGLQSIGLQNIEGLQDLSGEDINLMAKVFADRFMQRSTILGLDPFVLFQSENITFERIPDPGLSETAGQILFQPGEKDPDPGPPRGVTVFRAAGINIGFFKDADRSTFFHEMGHLWIVEIGKDFAILKRRPRLSLTPAQLKFLADAETTLDFLGIKSFDDLTRELSEKWAKEVELFFLEGKAPTPKMRSAFRVFRDWLFKVYRDWTGQGASISPEIRGVMNRLLASQGEVALAEAREDVDRLFPNPETVGMSPEQARKLAEVALEGEALAEEQVASKLMRTVRRRLDKQEKIERAKVREQVLSEVSQKESAIALSILSKGVMPDGSVPDFPGGKPASKMSKAAIIAEYGEEVLRTLPRSVWSQKGITADHAAEEINGVLPSTATTFRSGDHLIKTLIEVFEQERRTSPIFGQEAEIRKRIAVLRDKQEELEEEAAPITAIGRRAKAILRAEQAALESRVARELIQQERDSNEALKSILSEIRDFGGIRPTEPTLLLPRRFKETRKGAGMASDEVADMFFNRGIIDGPFFDDLLDFLNEAVITIDRSRKRIREEIPAEAKRLAKQKTKEAIDVLIQTVKDLGILNKELAEVKKERRLVERSIEVKGSLDNIVDRITDERMDARTAEIQTEEQLRDEAVAAVHNSKQAEVIRLEMKWLVSEQFATFKKLATAVAGAVKTSKAYREEAQDAVASLQVEDILPLRFQRASNKASRAALKAFFAGDFTEAFIQKQIQLEELEKFRAAKKAVVEVDRIVKFMAQFEKLVTRQRLGRARGEYLEQIDAIMERHEFRKISQRTQKSRKSLAEWAEAEFEKNGVPPVISPVLLDEARKVNFKELTFEELVEIRDTVKNIDHLSRLKNKLLKTADKRAFNLRKVEALASIEANAKGIKKVPFGPLTGVAKAVRKVKSVGAMQITLDAISHQFDGFKDNGVIWNLISRPLNTATTEETVRKEVASKRLKELNEAFTKEDDKIFHTLKTIAGVGIDLSLHDRLAVMLNWGNLDSRAKLLEGMSITAKKTITTQHIQTIIDTLEERHVNYVQSVWDYFEEFWAETQALSERVDGIAVERVEAEDVQTRFGLLRGGYYPIRYDRRQSSGASNDQAKEAVDLAMAATTLRSTTRHGHRQARVSGVKQPLLLDLMVIPQHVSQIIHDQTHYEVLIDVNRTIRDVDIRNAIVDRHGDVIYDEMLLAFNAIAAGSRPAENAYEEAASWLRRGSTVARLAWKATVIGIQPLGITNSFVFVGPKWILKGLGVWLSDAKNRENTVAEVFRLSPFMRTRPLTLDREVNEAFNVLRARGKTAARFLTKMESWGLYLTVRFQLYGADMPTWLGARERWTAELRPDQAKSQEEKAEIEQRIIDLADQAVKSTQGAGNIKDLARIARSKGFTSLFTQFATFFLARFNVARASFKKTDFRSVPDIGRFMVDMMVLYWVPTVIAAVALHLLRGGDEDDLIGKIMLDAALEPLADIIGVRELLGPLKGHRYQGPPVAQVVEETGRAAVKLASGEMDQSFLKSLNRAAGILFQYPSAQIEATIRGLAAWESGEAGPGAVIFGPPPRRR